MRIRTETAEDQDASRQVHRRAFPGEGEARLVDDLRRDGDVAISLVAETEGEIVGHILFSRLQAQLRALALAPLAVRPEEQGRGIGSALIRAGLDQASAENWEAVFVLGAPAFYGRFGFSLGAAKGFASAYKGPHFMAKVLSSGPIGRGTVNYPVAFAALD
jgi:putative acetyltransferase